MTPRPGDVLAKRHAVDHHISETSEQSAKDEENNRKKRLLKKWIKQSLVSGRQMK